MTDNTPQEDTLAETENYEAWISYEDDSEPIFHLDLGRVTIHMFQEEWDELRDLFALVEDED